MTIKERLRIHREIEEANRQHMIDFLRTRYLIAKEAYEQNPTEKNATRYLEANDQYFSALNH